MKRLPAQRPCGARPVLPSRARRAWGTLAGIGLLLPVLSVAAEAPRRSFDLPAGGALATLKQFAAQSGEQVLYSPDDVAGVQTPAVRGEFTSVAALTRMLGHTTLRVRQDPDSRAISITAPSPPAAQSSRSPATPADEPAPPPPAPPLQQPPPGMKKRTLLSVVAGWLALGVFGHAQPGPAGPEASGRPAAGVSVIGQVSNQVTGDVLPGAVVQVEGTALTTVAERGGYYSLALPPGTHTLLVSYAGLDPQRVVVNVSHAAPVTRDVALTSTVYKMDALTVAGVREGNAMAIQTQRQAENPKWVVATDTFGNPAVNPGELIQRMPGISADIVGGQIRTIYLRGMGTGFSALLVDGDLMASSSGTSASRDYQIEQLGTGNLETVEVIKAPQPEQDANAVAGFINLVSRRGFDASGRKIALTLGTMWRARPDVSDSTPFKDRPGLDLITLTYSDVFNVFGKAKNLGIAFNFSRRASSTGVDEMGPNFVYSTAQAYLNPTSANPLARTWGTGDFGQDPASVAYNAGLSVDYKLGPDSTVFAKFAYNNHYQPQKGLRAAIGNPLATAAEFSADSTFEHSFLLPHPASTAQLWIWPEFTKHARNYAVNGGSEFKLFDRNVTVSLRGNYSYADISYPGTLLLRGATTHPGGIGFEIDRRGRDAWYPLIRQTAGPSIYDPASYNMSTLTQQTFRAPTHLLGARVDVTKKFDAPVPLSIKAGAKYASDERSVRTDYNAWTFVGQDGIANSTDDAITPYVDLSYKQGGNRYGPWPFVTKPLAVPSGYWRQTATDAYNTIVTRRANNVEYLEQITAGYIQGSMRFGRLRVLGGVRIEQTKTEGVSWLRNTTPAWGGNSEGGASLDPTVVAANAARAERSFVRRNTGEGKYHNVFPGLHFVYEAGGGFLARASYNRAISRPSVATLLPTVTENPDTRTVSMGNPGLKPFLTDNFDVSVEKYFEPVGLFSLGAFLKEIADYSRTISTTVGPEGVDGSGTYAGYQLSMAQNIGSARVRGIEASYQQQLSFLPGALNGLGVFANFTYLSTLGDFGGLVQTSKLVNLAPRSGNAGINYRYRGLDVRLLLNWTDKKLRQTVNNVDVFGDKRSLLDLKVQYTLRRGYDLFFDVSNLTDEPVGTLITMNGIHHFRENGGVFFSAGIRARY